tara:strand:+ start:1294 stop:1521 length:228 start_codon:yes stop_codon:yes gene_type:complete
LKKFKSEKKPIKNIDNKRLLKSQCKSKNRKIVIMRNIPPEKGGSILLSINFLWKEVFFLSFNKLNFVNKMLSKII